MIQFNLLPDVKLEYIKAQRSERLVISSSVILGATAFVIFGLLFLTVHVFQKNNMTHLSSDIKKASVELRATKDLDKILTVQNQIGALSTLHEGKPVDNRLFGYLEQLTPASASISKIDVDHTLTTIKLSGTGTNMDAVNTFVDTLKFTKYDAPSLKSEKEKPLAFSDVVLTSFGRDEKGASYTIDLKFNPAIFSNTEEVSLIVPQQTTTRSVLNRPDLFQGEANETGQ
jgi:hypothetical protein